MSLKCIVFLYVIKYIIVNDCFVICVGSSLLSKTADVTLPLNLQQLTPVQTAIQRMSEKHLDFEIEPVNTIQPPEIKCTQTPQAPVPIDTPLSIIYKHIPRQSDIDKIVRNIETHVSHSLELPIQAQDLVKVYQHSTHFHDICQYITDGKLPSSVNVQNCIRTEALNYVIINNFLFRIDT